MKTNPLLLIIAAFAFGSCNLKAKTEMETQTSNIAVAKQVYDHFNKHEWEKMAALYSETADFKDPSFGPEVVKQTRQEIAQKYRELSDMFPDVRDDLVEIYPSGEKNVVVEFVSSGTAPDGSKWALPICTIFTIENGQITKDYTYYDNSQPE